MDNLTFLILCGGFGTRLWPLSDEQRPKHLRSIIGDESLLQQTVRRLLEIVPPQRIRLVTHRSQGREVRDQVRKIANLTEENVLEEPSSLNTLPAVTLGVMKISADDPEAIVGVIPADHLILDQTAFQSDLKQAVTLAERSFLVTLGIRPSGPETGFGYIRAGETLEGGARRAKAFVEKPDAETAEGFLTQGDYFWNSGIFVFRASVFLKEVQRLAEPLWCRMKRLAPESTQEDLAAIYGELEPLSIDTGIMERSDKVAVIPASFDWSDLGTWKSVHQVSPKDADGNIKDGPVIDLGSRNCLLVSKAGTLATIGLDRCAVIQTEDAVLVSPLDRSQDVRGIVEELGKRAADSKEKRAIVVRPWGTYTVLEEAPGYKIKKIVVERNQKLSLQRHRHRSEHWVVIEGTAGVVNGDHETVLQASESTFIEKGRIHRLENRGTTPLTVIEVQAGPYLGEDDIERFDDAYGRQPAAMLGGKSAS